MTSQEAISVLESVNAKTDYFLINDDARVEAIDMAISALQEQDAPDINVDTISRQRAIDAFDCTDELIVGGEANAQNVVNYINKVVGKIETLPPAQPERKKPVFKTGESVYHVSYADGTGGFKKTNGQIGLALIAVGSLVNSISHGVTISRNAITVPNADALLIGRMRI